MMKPMSLPMMRLFVAGAVLVTALACEETGCSCMTPLARPPTDQDLLYDAIQARVSPRALEFIQGNLQALLPLLMPGGLNFAVAPMSQEVCIDLDRRICFNLDVCSNGCQIGLSVNQAEIEPNEPSTITLNLDIDASGMIDIYGVVIIVKVDCDIPIHMYGKYITANVNLQLDPSSRLLTFSVSDVEISIEDEDFDLNCSGLIGGQIEEMKSEIQGMLNEQFGTQIDTALKSLLGGMVCMPCGFYTSGCPTGTSCNGEYCMNGSTCAVKPLGIAGNVNLGALLAKPGAEPPPGPKAEMGLYVAAGQRMDPNSDPMVNYDALELRLIGGAVGDRAACVDQPPAGDVPPNIPPMRMPFEEFDDLVPGTDTPFMVGIGVADAFLDWMLYKAYMGGALCLTLDTNMTSLISSGTISLLGMNSLNVLTQGRNVPMAIRLRPTRVPAIDVGLGSFKPDGTIDKPLLYLNLRGMALEFYALLDERWTRVVTGTMDIPANIGLEITPDNKFIPIIDEASIVPQNVVVSNNELLSESPESIAALLPTLVGMALPMLTGSLEAIELQGLPGMKLKFLSLGGQIQRPGTEFFDYMGIFVDLELRRTREAVRSRDTWVRLSGVEVPSWDQLSIHHPGGLVYPEVSFTTGSNRGAEAEYSYRIDRGAWSPFVRTTTIQVRNPKLALMGLHSLEVRARTVGDYRTLDPTPAWIEFEVIPPPCPEPFVARDEAAPGSAGDDPWEISPAASANPATLPDGMTGCATAAPAAGITCIGLLIVLLRRRGQ